jgi:hypothetical protein
MFGLVSRDGRAVHAHGFEDRWPAVWPCRCRDVFLHKAGEWRSSAMSNVAFVVLGRRCPGGRPGRLGAMASVNSSSACLQRDEGHRDAGGGVQCGLTYEPPMTASVISATE